MASQQRPPRRPPQQPEKPPIELPKFDFDPHRLKLPQAAIVGFAIGIFFHACVVFAVLDDGSGGGSSAGGSPREEVTIPQATATPSPLADRTDCNAIRTTGDYRSEAERQWFLRNCTGG